METQGLQRKLAAILCADVAGYSRMMGADDAATLAALTACRDIFSRLVQQFHGRIVNQPGDSILAEFGSVVDAVASAVEIQRELAERNAGLPSAQRMDFRIGVNLGDVIVKDGDLYGDGVNIAARVQTLANPGEVCISGSAHREVKSKLPLEFEFQGNKSVKNIVEPVPVYRVLSKPGAAAHRVTLARRAVARNWRKLALVGAAAAVLMAVGGAGAWYFVLRHGTPSIFTGSAVPSSDQPSIAVLPFTNMSGDPEQEYFADGITETLITDLSKLRGLKVIARNSVFTYKGKAVDVRDVRKTLGVRFVLEGSIQRVANSVRITTQLIDAATGNHIWAERYDRSIQDLFSLQDEIATRLVTEMDVKLAEGESAREWRRTTRVPEAYDFFLKARQAQTLFTRQDMVRARELAAKALELDPNFAMAHWMVGVTHYDPATAGWVEDPQRSLELARASFRRAIELDDSLGIAYAMLGAVSLSLDLDHDRAMEYGMKAISVNPNGAFEHAVLAVFLAYSGKSEEALLATEQAFKLNPIPEGWYYHPLGAALLFLGRTEDAIAKLQECVTRLPNYIYCNVNLTVAYVMAGDEEKARAQAKQVLRNNPAFSISTSIPIRRIKDPDVRERFAAALRQAGLP